MTVATTTNRVSYNGDGTTVGFPFTFKVFEDTDIQVVYRDALDVETTLTLDTDFTVALSDPGGTVTLINTYAADPPAIGTRITVYRDISYTQEIDLVQNDPQNADVLEEGYDRAVILAQQLKDSMSRSLLLPVSSSASDLTLPEPDATKFLRWNAAGTDLENMDISAVGDLVVSPFIETLLDDTSAADARATLGVTLANLGLDADLATFALPASTTISAFGKTLVDDADASAARATLAIVPADFSAFMTNLSLVATVGSKALTVALKTKAGTDPSASDKVQIAFRNATITSGDYVVRDVAAALSVVLSSGSTLGFTAALAGRIYIWAIDNAGTVELALSRTADIFQESNLVSTTAEGGAGAADSATVMYSTTARSNLACRCLGYIDITTGATAGEWDTAPTKIQIMGPGVKRTGELVQTASAQTSALLTCTTVMPIDDTIPQKTEGDEILTVTLTPKAAINSLLITFNTFSGHYVTSGHCAIGLFQDDVAGALAAALAAPVYQANYGLRHWMTAGVAVATTFKIRIGPKAAGTAYVNCVDGGATRAFGGVASTILTVQEIEA